MANLIIKSSADNLVLQGSDASPAITVATSGTTTFAENATLSGTANALGTVTAGTIGNAVTGVNQKLLGFSAYLSTAKTVNNATWTEIDTTWTKRFDTNSKFGTTSGRFTPTVAGVYHIGYVTSMDTPDDNERIIGRILRNSSDASSEEYGKFQNRATGANATISCSSSALIVLDADDYVSLYCYHDGGGNDPIGGATETQFWGYYVGTV